MKRFKVHILMEILDDLCELAMLGSQANVANEEVKGRNQSESIRRLNEAIRLCQDFGFGGPLQFAKRSKGKVSKGVTFARLKEIAEELRSRVQDDFQEVLLLWIEEPEFVSDKELFGKRVGRQFQRASVDISEAGKCYAMGRYTACVYHLMRVSEFGLSAIAKRIKFADPRPNWETVLVYIDKQLKTKHDEMSSLFKGDKEFLSGIASQMHDVNLAWRRRVSHIERVYTKDEARRIFDATKGLMEHLAEKLSED